MTAPKPAFQRPLSPEWLAAADGTAHVTVARGYRTRTVCGRRPVTARFAWPKERRCSECASTLKALEQEIARA